MDHRRIAARYLVSIVGAFFLGGLFALALRTELIGPGQTFVDPDLYNQMLSLHGTMMIFLFVIPAIPAVLGNLMLPPMLGVRNVAYPRVNLCGWWLWIGGAVVTVASMVLGRIDMGWNFYAPYLSTARGAVVWLVCGLFLVGCSSMLTGLNFIVTLRRARRSDGSLRIPLFCWGLSIGAVVQTIVTPILGGTALLLIAERIGVAVFFDPALGGNPLLLRHLFWLYAHPAVYVTLVPAIGVVSELISSFSGRPIVGRRLLAWNCAAIGVLSLLGWGRHTLSGTPSASALLHSVLGWGIAVPVAIVVFCWLATLHSVKLRLETPMLYGLAFVVQLLLGVVTGLLLGLPALGAHLRETTFMVGHLHYALFGGVLIAFLGGLHHWWPELTGRMYDDRMGRVGFWVLFFGFNLTFLALLVMGTRGMPRRYFDYAERFTTQHGISTLGAYLMAAGFAVILLYLMHSLYRGRPVFRGAESRGAAEVGP